MAASGTLDNLLRILENQDCGKEFENSKGPLKYCVVIWIDLWNFGIRSPKQECGFLGSEVKRIVLRRVMTKIIIFKT